MCCKSVWKLVHHSCVNIIVALESMSNFTLTSNLIVAHGLQQPTRVFGMHIHHGRNQPHLSIRYTFRPSPLGLTLKPARHWPMRVNFNARSATPNTAIFFWPSNVFISVARPRPMLISFLFPFSPSSLVPPNSIDISPGNASTSTSLTAERQDDVSHVTPQHSTCSPGALKGQHASTASYICILCCYHDTTNNTIRHNLCKGRTPDTQTTTAKHGDSDIAT
jgi:hypothetical protein